VDTHSICSFVRRFFSRSTFAGSAQSFGYITTTLGKPERRSRAREKTKYDNSHHNKGVHPLQYPIYFFQRYLYLRFSHKDACFALSFRQGTSRVPTDDF
jgi:hypothetical protein